MHFWGTRLPKVKLALIYEYLDGKNYYKATLVCKLWASVKANIKQYKICCYTWNTKHLNLNISNNFNNKMQWLYNNASQSLKVLSIKGNYKMTNEEMLIIIKFNKLECLLIEWQISGVTMLGTLPHLKRLELCSGSFISNEMVGLVRLEELVLNQCNVARWSCDWLKSLINLKSLSIIRCSDGLDVLIHMCGQSEIIEKLVIVSEHVVNIKLDGMKKLVKLDLKCSNLTEGLLSLCELDNLVEVNISECKRLPCEELCELGNLRNLRALNVSGCAINDAVLSNFSKLENLQVLNLSYCDKITDRGISYLRGIVGLKEINTRWCFGVTYR